MQEKIIHFLKQSQSYVSGEEISHHLNISRAAIWKHMQELRTQGYEIVAVPHLGYQLIAVPDKLFPHEILFGLKTKIMGTKILAFETLPSTMDEAFRLGMQGASEGTVVCAEGQTKGRGRLGRAWISPKGKGIYCSIILRPKLPPAQLSRLTLASAVAVAEAVHKKTGLQPAIKWPNDLVIGTKKLAGILTEMRGETDEVTFVVVGIGLNVNASPNQIVETATSLKNELHKNINRIELFQEILGSMEKWYAKVLKGNFVDVIKYCRKHSATLKQRVRIADTKGVLEGKAKDIDIDGGLLVQLENGKVIKKIAGDVLIIKK